MQAYGKARSEGTNEIGSILLSISSDLLAFDFKETFVNAFDVSRTSCPISQVLICQRLQCRLVDAGVKQGS